MIVDEYTDYFMAPERGSKYIQKAAAGETM